MIPRSDSTGYNTDVSKADRIVVYEGSDCRFDLYTDAGDGYGFEKEQYCLATLSYTETDHKVSTVKTEGSFPFESSFKVEHIRPQGL